MLNLSDNDLDLDIAIERERRRRMAAQSSVARTPADDQQLQSFLNRSEAQRQFIAGEINPPVTDVSIVPYQPKPLAPAQIPYPEEAEPSRTRAFVGSAVQGLMPGSSSKIDPLMQKSIGESQAKYPVASMAGSMVGSIPILAAGGGALGTIPKLAGAGAKMAAREAIIGSGYGAARAASGEAGVEAIPEDALLFATMGVLGEGVAAGFGKVKGALQKIADRRTAAKSAAMRKAEERGFSEVLKDIDPNATRDDAISILDEFEKSIKGEPTKPTTGQIESEFEGLDKLRSLREGIESEWKGTKTTSKEVPPVEPTAAGAVTKPSPAAPISPEPQKAASKQPWEMTRDVYRRTHISDETIAKRGEVEARSIAEDATIADRQGFEYSSGEKRSTLGAPNLARQVLDKIDASVRVSYKRHARLVEQALSEGKPVPASVLADYPDLAAKYGKQVEPPKAAQGATPAQSTNTRFNKFKKSLEPVDTESKGAGSWGVNDDGSIRIRLMRSGSEFGDLRRGGTWYEVNSFEGKEPTYGAGKPWMRKVPGVGGNQRWDVEEVFKNPLVVNIDNASEAYYPLRAIKQLLGKEEFAKWEKRLKRNSSKEDIERHFSKLESTMSEEAAKQGHDGVIFYYTLTDGTRSFPDQVFKISPDLAAKYGKGGSVELQALSQEIADDLGMAKAKRTAQDTTLRGTVGFAAGIEKDDDGNWHYNPAKGLLGFGAGVLAVGAFKNIKGAVNEKLATGKVNKARLQITEAGAYQIDKAMQEFADEIGKKVGRKLTFEETLEAAEVANSIKGAWTREQTEQALVSQLKLRQVISRLADGSDVSTDLVNALRENAAYSAMFARGLGSRRILAEGDDPIKLLILKKLIQLGKTNEEIAAATKGIDFTNAAEATKFYRQYVKPKLPQLLDEFRYINLLSSPKTHIVNAFSNALQVGVIRPATRLVSGGVDFIGSRVTGKAQNYYLSQAPAYYRGAFGSIDKATKSALDALRGKAPLYRPDLDSLPSMGESASKLGKPLAVFNRTFGVIPRALEASDVFFRTLVEAGEKEALAVRYAKQGIDIAEGALTKEAQDTAAETIFRKALDPQNKSGQGAVLSWIDKGTSAVYKFRSVPGVKWFIPFVATPMNILKQGIEYSPFGVATLIKNADKSQQLSKALIGSTVFSGAALLAFDDRLTWQTPKNEKDRAIFYDAGMQPYSVKIGDKWVQYSRLGPLAYPMAMAAALKFYMQDNNKALTDSQLDKATKAISGIAGFFADQSYVEGIGQLVDAIGNPRGGTSELAKTVATEFPQQLIPLSALDRWVAQLIDPIYRKPESGISWDAIVDNMAKGLPFASKTLEPYKTPSGEPSRRQMPGLNAVLPTTVTKEDQKKANILGERRKAAQQRALKTQKKEDYENEQKKRWRP